MRGGWPGVSRNVYEEYDQDSEGMGDMLLRGGYITTGILCIIQMVPIEYKLMFWMWVCDVHMLQSNSGSLVIIYNDVEFEKRYVMAANEIYTLFN